MPDQSIAGGTTSGNILPANAGQDLGSSSQRWDVFARNLDFETIGAISATRGQQLTYSAINSRWEPQSKPWVDVRDYGAVGDGSTDDTTAIQAAIDAVAVIDADGIATASGTVFFPIPSANYKITRPLYYIGNPGDTLLLRGELGRTRGPSGSVITWAGPAGANMLLMIGANESRIENLDFSGGGLAKNLLWADSSNEIAASANYTISAISRASSGIVSVTTSTSHAIVPDSIVRVSGVTDSSFNGVFKCLYSNSNTTFAYVQSSTVASSSGGIARLYKSAGSSGLSFLNASFADWRSVSTTISSISGSFNDYDLTTTTAHYLNPGDIVITAGGSDSSYNGVWQVTSVDSSTTASIRLFTDAWLASAPGAGPSTGGTCLSGSTAIRLGHRAASTSQVSEIKGLNLQLRGGGGENAMCGIQMDQTGNTKNFHVDQLMISGSYFGVVGVRSGIGRVTNYVGNLTGTSAVGCIDFAGCGSEFTIDGATTEADDCRFFISTSNIDSITARISGLSYQSSAPTDRIVIAANGLVLDSSKFQQGNGAANPVLIRAAGLNFASNSGIMDIRNCRFQYATTWVPVVDGSGNAFMGSGTILENRSVNLFSLGNWGGSDFRSVLNNYFSGFIASQRTSASTVATTGDFRLPSDGTFNFADNAGTGNLNGLTKDSSDIVRVGDTSGVRLGNSSGTAIKQVRKFTGVTVDFAEIAATTRGSVAVTIAGTPGIASGDTIIVISGPEDLEDDIIFLGAKATGVNQVTFYAYNPTGSPINPASLNDFEIEWHDLT